MKIKWNKPEGDREQTRTSKCGRYSIRKGKYAGSRNGCWVPSYSLTILKADGSVEYKFDDYDRLGDAKDDAQEDANEKAAA